MCTYIYKYTHAFASSASQQKGPKSNSTSVARSTPSTQILITIFNLKFKENTIDHWING